MNTLLVLSIITFISKVFALPIEQQEAIPPEQQRVPHPQQWAPPEQQWVSPEQNQMPGQPEQQWGQPQKPYASIKPNQWGAPEEFAYETVPEKYVNVPLEKENPSSVYPPGTDARSLPAFKYSFALAHKEQYNGGWTRTVTQADLPIATTFSAAQIFLQKNAIRELHWHDCAEIGFVIYGDVRVTAFDPSGNASVQDLSATDVFSFPRGHPHSFQGIGEGTFYLAVYQCGNFVATSTYNLVDWLNHLPPWLLAKNFKTPPATFRNLKMAQSIILGSMPGPLQVEQAQVANGTGQIVPAISFKTSSIDPQVVATGGTAKLILSSIFPGISVTLVIFNLHPGGINALHWHPNADEWQYYISGFCRMNVFGGDGRSRTMDFEAGDIGYVSANQGHYIENTGSEDCVFIALLPTTAPETVLLAQWLDHVPTPLLLSTVGINLITSNPGFIEPA